jgi:signal transduction histidine kinase
MALRKNKQGNAASGSKPDSIHEIDGKSLQNSLDPLQVSSNPLEQAHIDLEAQLLQNAKQAEDLLSMNSVLSAQNSENERLSKALSNATSQILAESSLKEDREKELTLANKALGFEVREREKRAAELMIANTELLFQNGEKERRAIELDLANIALAFENSEKEKRAAELQIANARLLLENNEKELRALELSATNKELAFQYREKRKRADELVAANLELRYQSAEKEKRAAELSIACIELEFQRGEKEKRAAEFIIAHKELLIQNREKIERTKQLESMNKELESFSYSVSHDLRAPLRAVQGYAHMLKEALGELGPEKLRLLNSIINNAKKMGQLIDDLLTFSRLGRKDIQAEKINMNELVADVCQSLFTEEDRSRTDLLVSELPEGFGDTATLKLVWTNLISNAIKYSGLKAKACIAISAKDTGDEVVYSIKDNGAGFDMRFADKLFGVFQRLHSEDEFEGTGVGLASVNRIITKHSGRVWGEGALNQGATFYFTLNTEKQ